MTERRSGNNYAAWAIAVGLFLNTAAFSFWMGRLAQTVSDLKVAIVELRKETPSLDSFNAALRRIELLER